MYNHQLTVLPCAYILRQRHKTWNLVVCSAQIDEGENHDGAYGGLKVVGGKN
jgi:hypothetical protein